MIREWKGMQPLADILQQLRAICDAQQQRLPDIAYSARNDEPSPEESVDE